MAKTLGQNIPETLTTDHVVNFLKPFNRGFYSDTDLRTLLNSSISSDVKITAINSVAKAVALNENQMTIFRQMVKQIMLKLRLKFRHLDDKEESGPKFEGLDKVIQTAINQFEEQPPLNKDGLLDFDAVKNLKLLIVMNDNAEALNEFHKASMERLSASLDKARDFLDNAGILKSDAQVDQIMSNMKKHLSKAESFPDYLSKLDISDLHVPLEKHFEIYKVNLEKKLKGTFKDMVDTKAVEKAKKDENNPFFNKTTDQIFDQLFTKAGMKKYFDNEMAANEKMIKGILNNPEKAAEKIEEKTKALNVSNKPPKWTDAHNGLKEKSKDLEETNSSTADFKKG